MKKKIKTKMLEDKIKCNIPKDICWQYITALNEPNHDMLGEEYKKCLYDCKGTEFIHKCEKYIKYKK